VVPLNVADANSNRDALSKLLYGALFSWLVGRINKVIAGESDSSKAFIGVLDIFGFENFAVNSFEQFCINFTNEKLQNHFNQYIFKLEQEEYAREGINWSKIEFVDNQNTIELIEKRPIGIISLLDEECRFPKGTDLTLLDKLHMANEKNENYEKTKNIKKHICNQTLCWTSFIHNRWIFGQKQRQNSRRNVGIIVYIKKCIGT